MTLLKAVFRQDPTLIETAGFPSAALAPDGLAPLFFQFARTFSSPIFLPPGRWYRRTGAPSLLTPVRAGSLPSPFPRPAAHAHLTGSLSLLSTFGVSGALSTLAEAGTFFFPADSRESRGCDLKCPRSSAFSFPQRRGEVPSPFLLQ